MLYLLLLSNSYDDDDDDDEFMNRGRAAQRGSFVFCVKELSNCFVRSHGKAALFFSFFSLDTKIHFLEPSLFFLRPTAWNILFHTEHTRTHG